MATTLTRLNRLTAELTPAGDAALLGAFLAGDQAAFAALVRRHAGLVFATCRRVLRHEQDAEDAFQATFLVLARRAADVWPREAVASWLFGVAHRVALKARQRRDRRAGREQALEDAAATETERADFDLVEAVHRVIGKLPEVYRAAVIACDLEGLSRKDAAERLGWREGTLSGRLARARELLAARLRRLGYALPAGGLAGFAAAEPAPLRAVESALGVAAGAGAAPVAVLTLTEGMVRSMALGKLKSLGAVVFTACAIGAGVFAAASGSGAGATGPAAAPSPRSAGQQPPARPPERPAEPPAKQPDARPKGARVELAQKELEILRAELAAAGKGKIDPDAMARLHARLEAISRLLDANDGALIAKPRTDRDRLQGRWRVVSLTEGGRTTSTNPKEPWEVEVSGGTLKMPYLEGGKQWKQREYSFALDESKSPRTIDLIAKNAPVGRGLYEFVGGFTLCSSCHNHPFVEKGATPALTDVWPLCEQALKNAKAIRDAGLRLALAIDGKRPTKFGGGSVIVFNLTRLDSVPDGRSAAGGKAELERLAAAVEKAQLESQAARLELSAAEAEFAKAKKAYEAVEAKWGDANRRWQAAQRAYEQAKQRIENRVPLASGGYALPGEVFSIHVRTLAAAEKVIRVKATGRQTVLEGLVYAADDVPIKSDAVSVWVVRDKTVMPVDLAAITKGGDAKTNYALKPGDQLFVQAKPAK